MQQKEVGFIGGSGIYQVPGMNLVKEHHIDTPFGKPSGPISEMEFEGHRIWFLPRHGQAHSLLPSEINYRANIFALKTLGVEYLVSVSAVGSLKEELAPKSFFLPDQFIDWTKGKRERTFFGEGVIGHVSTAYPIDKTLQGLVFQACEKAGAEVYKDGSYVCIEGPQFSSRAESEIYRSFGASVIGMTNVPEAYLAKEAGMAYTTMAMVTDYDCWKEHHCTVDEIMKVVKSNTETAQKVFTELVPILSENKFDFVKENAFGVLTPKEMIPADKQEIIEVLLK